MKLLNLLRSEPSDTSESCITLVIAGMTKNDLATDSFEDAIETIEQGLTGPSESSLSLRKFD